MIATAAVFLGLVLLRWALVFGVGVALVPRVRSCPACFHDTIPIRKPWLRRLAPSLEWRWCPSCGWRGPSSRSGSELVPPPADGREMRKGRLSSPGNTGSRFGDSSEREG